VTTPIPPKADEKQGVVNKAADVPGRNSESANAYNEPASAPTAENETSGGTLTESITPDSCSQQSGDTMSEKTITPDNRNEGTVVPDESASEPAAGNQTVTTALPETVAFGSYPQNGSGAEPIEWLVIDSDDSSVLLLSKYCLASLPWHNSRETVTWDNSDIRAWLNGEFYRTAFTAEEQAAILPSVLDNGDDLGYGTPVGGNTEDRVFLLSANEALSLLSEGRRAAEPTAYALRQGAYTNSAGDCAWWLRSPGMTETSPAYFASAGEIGSRAHHVDETIIGVRPAIWIQYQSKTLPDQSSAFIGGLPIVSAGETANEKSAYIDDNGDSAVIPAQFSVSEKQGEQTISTGLVVIGPDNSEFVWIPTTQTALAARDFGSYFSSGSSFSDYHDEVKLDTYQDMASNVEKYGGFYLGRYEASKGTGGLPTSRRVTTEEPGSIWVQFSPQDTTVLCQKLYAGNETVQGFFPWGVNWDTALQWLIDSGCKTEKEVTKNSTGWGNYSDDSFSPSANGRSTGRFGEAKANNIYDLAGNNWEWTQERYGGNYVMRGGGYNLMGGSCSGARYPAALRDPLPGNNHHPNVTFRIALYVK